VRARFLLPLLVLVAGCAKNEPASGTAGDGFSSPSDLASQAGVTIYPGAAVPSNKSSITSQDRETRYEIVMTTSDKPEKVLSFYEKQLGNAQKMGDKMMGFGANGSSIIVSALVKGTLTEIHAVSVVEKKG